MVLKAKVVLADTHALDTSVVFTPAAETLTFLAYVSTTFSTLSFGPYSSVESSAAASAVAFCALPWVARALARFSRHL